MCGLCGDILHMDYYLSISARFFVACSLPNGFPNILLRMLSLSHFGSTHYPIGLTCTPVLSFSLPTSPAIMTHVDHEAHAERDRQYHK